MKKRLIFIIASILLFFLLCIISIAIFNFDRKKSINTFKLVDTAIDKEESIISPNKDLHISYEIFQSRIDAIIKSDLFNDSNKIFVAKNLTEDLVLAHYNKIDSAKLDLLNKLIIEAIIRDDVNTLDSNFYEVFINYN